MKKEKMTFKKLSLVAALTLPLSIFALHSNAQFTISGTVINDLDGINDNKISGTSVNPSADLKVVLYDNTINKVAAVDTDLSNGYNFISSSTSNYTLYLTSATVTAGQTAKPAKKLPEGWIYSGETKVSIGTPDPISNGELELGVVNGNLVTSFGITTYAAFVCSQAAYQVAGTIDRNSGFYKYDVSNGSRIKIADLNFEANAIGFDNKTNVIWGIDQDKDRGNIKVVLIDSIGKSIFYKVPNLPNQDFNVGTVIANNYLLVNLTTANKYYVIDINPERASFMQLADPKNSFQIDNGTDSDGYGTACSQNLDFNDLSYDYDAQVLRGLVNPDGLQDTKFRLFTLNPLTGLITVDNARVTGGNIQNETDAYGSIFSYATPGKLYVFANSSPNNKGRFFEIDIATRTAKLLSTTNSASNNDGTNCSSSSLPVSFGNISAEIKKDALFINWTSFSETENSYFEIEVSEDGKNFTSIGKVNSKAVEGNSNEVLIYEFIQPTAALTLGISLALLFAGCMGFNLRRKQKAFLLSISMITLFSFISCNQNKDVINNLSNNNLFVRIIQVDKDGTKSYSKIVKAYIK